MRRPLLPAKEQHRRTLRSDDAVEPRARPPRSNAAKALRRDLTLLSHCLGRRDRPLGLCQCRAARIHRIYRNDRSCDDAGERGRSHGGRRWILRRSRGRPSLAAFLGWMLDAFDFFLLTFLLKDIAKEFGVEVLGGGVRAVPDAGDAVRRRLHLRPAWRPVGTQAGADARHPLLFDPRRARRLLAEPHGLPDLARAVRRRHGRRMGPRQFAGDGIDSAAGARVWCPAFCNAAIRPASCSPRSPMACSSAERSATTRSAGGRCSCSASCPPSSCCSSAAACPNRRRSRRRKAHEKPSSGRRSRSTRGWSSTWSC